MKDFLKTVRDTSPDKILNGELNLKIALDDQIESQFALVMAAELEAEGLHSSAKASFEEALGWEEAALKGLVRAAESEGRVR